MAKEHPINKEHGTLLPALLSKCEEFALLGYHEVTEAQLWQFMLKKKWKKSKGGEPLHQLFNDIMRVNIGEYMNFAAVEGFKESTRHASTDLSEFRDLFS
ncbi:post-transcriptional regulator [Bacillus testis]|uniref:post-transcriptional regulator n=1 Tax=Bacillus testis TaxID=1622072 RepID=UPI00067EFF39|nr:post-transcriptional regulator [Bacillus testis]